MNLSSRQIAELVGIIAVVLSIIFVAIELRQSNRIAIATAEAEIRASQREFYLMAIESSEAAKFLSGVQTLDSLSLEEQDKFYSYVIWNFSNWASAAMLYENGLLSDYSIGIFITSMEDFIEVNPAGAQLAAQQSEVLGLEKGMNIMWDALIDELQSRGY